MSWLVGVLDDNSSSMTMQGTPTYLLEGVLGVAQFEEHLQLPTLDVHKEKFDVVFFQALAGGQC